MTIFNKLSHVTFAEHSVYPIIFLTIFKNTLSFKDAIFKITNVKITIFKPFFAHASDLRILEISSFKRFDYKIVTKFVIIMLFNIHTEA